MNRIWIVIVIITVSACTGKDSLPSGIIGKEKMKSVLWDMIQADNYYRESIAKDSLTKNVKAERFHLYDQVLQLHKVNRSTFDKSFSYYSEHPVLIKSVFDSLSAMGTRRLQEFYKPAIPVKDTISHNQKQATHPE